MKNTILLIAGLGRSGTSLALQCLSAAGVPVPGDYPSFEPEEALTMSPEFIDANIGGAIKWLDPHKSALPPGRSYKVVMMTRSKRQQAMSMIKFIECSGSLPPGKQFTPDAHMRMSHGIKDDQRRANAAVDAIGCPVLKIRFEDLVERPDTVLSDFAEFCGLPDSAIWVMRKEIRLRDGSCYPGLLELDLMRDRESREPTPEPFDLLKCQCNFPGNEKPCRYCRNGEFAVPAFNEPQTTPTR